MSFEVDKWYMDVVTDEGVAVIGYLLDVRWLGLDLRIASRLVARPGEPPDEKTTLGRSAVSHAGEVLTWTSEPLGVRATWRALEAPVSSTLLASPTGRIEWSCTHPRADATVVTTAATYEGLGYAEHVRLTVPPWALPFQTLRWGRHVSDGHSLVWIEWDGERTMRSAWLDGVTQPSARVVDGGVHGLESQQTLHWHEGRDLVRRSVGRAIGEVAPALSAHIAGRLAGLLEHKQLSRSSLIDAAGRALDHGWTIHEVVTW